MTKPKPKLKTSQLYHRCPKCKELISKSIPLENCPNCANKNPLGVNMRHSVYTGKRSSSTLDQQEQTPEWDT